MTRNLVIGHGQEAGHDQLGHRLDESRLFFILIELSLRKKIYQKLMISIVIKFEEKNQVSNH